MQSRPIYFVSDATALTVQQLGQALMAQFPDLSFSAHTLRFVNNEEKARSVARQIESDSANAPGIVLLSIVDPAVRAAFNNLKNVSVIDMLGTMMKPFESALGMAAQPIVGGAHESSDSDQYRKRIEAVEYALGHDDGVSPKGFEAAKLILLGVSRSGKTPTSIYLAMQFSIPVANYPLLPEDLETDALPRVLAPYREKLFGLTLSPERLASIRSTRKPNSNYAKLANCRREIHAALSLYRRERIPFLDSSRRSIEEMSSEIVSRMML